MALTLAGVLWVRDRLEWVRWLRRYITLLFCGLAIYIAYPMAPPWMAARDGYLDPVTRITRRGWDDIELFGVDLNRQTMVMFGMGNKVAAMPSLHFATSALAAILLAETGPDADAAGWGYASPLLIGAVLSVLGFGVLFAAFRSDRRPVEHRSERVPEGV